MNLFDKLLGRSPAGAVAWLETDELSALLNAASPPLVVDVRGPGEFSGPLGHIDGALNIPLDQLPTRTAEIPGGQRPVVLVCHTDRRSAAAAEYLRQAGVPDIAVLRGGMVAWRAQSMT